MIPIITLEQPFTHENRKLTVPWSRWLRRVTTDLNSQVLITAPLAGTVFSGTVVIAKLTSGGSNGSMVFNKGVLVSVTPAT